jgi:hypothetical protein
LPSCSFPQPCGTLAAFTRIPWSLQCRVLARPRRSFAGGELAAATRGWCRRAPSPTRPRSRPTPGIGRM